MKKKYLKQLSDAWTAQVELNNGEITVIWYTALPSMWNRIKKVIWVASDYPRRDITNSNFKMH